MRKNSDFNYDEFIRWEMANETMIDYAVKEEVFKDKDIGIITFNLMREEKHSYTNILVYVEGKLIVKNIIDFNLLSSELEIFNVDETAKFVELKSKKGENGIIYSLKIKGTNTYINKAEARTFVKNALRIERASKYNESSQNIKRCQEDDYINKLLSKSKIILDITL